MGIKLSDFANNVKDVARPNRFIMKITSAGSLTVPADFHYLVKSASVPPRTVGDVVLNWQGMQHKLAGDPTYDDYQVTFLSDVNYVARKFFEEWINKIANTSSNERAEPTEYLGQIVLDHIGRKETDIIASYKLFNAYPKQMDQIDVAYDNSDTAEEFSVTFSIDYWEYA